VGGGGLGAVAAVSWGGRGGLAASPGGRSARLQASEGSRGEDGRGGGSSGTPDESKRKLRTGDVLIFNRPSGPMFGKSVVGGTICALAKATSGSRFDHVGVVVVDPAEPERPRLVESNMPGGVRVTDFCDRVSRSSSTDISLRRLEGVQPSAEDEEGVRALVTAVDGKPYDGNVLKLWRLGRGHRAPGHAPATRKRLELDAHQARVRTHREAGEHSLADRLHGEVEHLRDAVQEELRRVPFWVNTETNRDAFFCSDLVALVHQKMRVLPHEIGTTDYTPAHFAAEAQVLPFLRGARLGDPVPLREKGVNKLDPRTLC